jgi:hypothetical protein
MWNNFRLARPEEANPYATTILAHLQEWLEDDAAVQELLEQAKVVDRATCSA